MRLLFSAVALATMVLASGCRNPTPNFNPYSAFGSPTVAPPPAGAYPASGVPGRPDAYYPGIQQPAGVTAPGYTQPPSAGAGFQSQNQQPVGTGTGWQASNSTNPAATTASSAFLPTNTAVNRATTPNITNGGINDASYGGAGVQQTNPTSSLLERIQRDRMPVHDATAPAGAAAPMFVPGYQNVPGYPNVPVYPTAPAQPVYQLQPSMTAVPGYSQLRGTALTNNSPTPAVPPGNSPTPVGRSVLVSSPSQNPPAANQATSDSEPVSSGDGLKWRSKNAPITEVATR